MKSFWLNLVLALFSGCSTAVAPVQGDIIGQPTNTPEAFVPESGVSLKEHSCRKTMVDPRNGRILDLKRSGGGVGDYQVPEGTYGIGSGELIRLDCGTGKVAGVVKE